MIDLFKKTLLIGIGAASLTAEHVKSLVEDLQKQGKLSREEAEKLAREMAIKTSDQVKALAAKLEEEGKLTREEIEKFAMDMAAKTSENIKKLAEELKDKGKISKEDAERFAREAVSKAETIRTDIEVRFADILADLIHRLKLVTREEFDAMEARVKALEEKLNQ